MASLRDSMKKEMMKKDKNRKPMFGFLGSQSKAYKEAQDALKEHEKMETADASNYEKE